MKNIVKHFVIVVIGCSLLLLEKSAGAAVTDEDFRALQQQLQELKKQRDQDRQEMEVLKRKLGETEKQATEADQKATQSQKVAAEAAAKAPVSGPSEESQARANFTITGYAHALWEKDEGKHGSFALGSFNPIFLFRASDKVVFEGELEVELHNGREDGGSGIVTDVGLEYAQVDYFLNDYVTAIAGKMLLPLGTFLEKTHPAWINKLPTFPAPREDETHIVPESGVGLQLRGALHVTPNDIFSYAAYGVNGPGARDPDATAASFDLDAGAFDNNNAPSGGGRLAWLHVLKPSYDLELGASGQSGVWNDASDKQWSTAIADATLHISPYFEARGEYLYTWLDTSDLDTRNPRGWWAQGAFKLAGLGLQLPVVNDLEFVYRYSTVKNGIDTTTQEHAIGLVYYIMSQLQLKTAYEFRHSNDEDLGRNRILVQVAYGF